MSATHYGVQVRVYLDSVGDHTQDGVDRHFSLKMLENGKSTYQTSRLNAKGVTIAAFADPIGIAGINTSVSLASHSASMSLLMGSVGQDLRTRLECQDTLRIEANTGDGWHCLFDGFVSGISWSQASAPGSYSWRLQLQAEGLHRLFRQGWLNWRMATTSGSADFLNDPEGRLIFQNLTRQHLGVAPQTFIGMMMEFGVSNLMKMVPGRDGTPMGRGSYWQLGNFDTAESGTTGDLWNNAMGLVMLGAAETYLNAEGSLWQTVSGFAEPALHELFITYAPRGNVAGADEIPTVVFRPIPFPGPQADPAPDSGAAQGVAYPDNAEWERLDILMLGGNNGPGPTSISASKSDQDRKNLFTWSTSSALDGDQAAFFYKMQLGYWADLNSIQRYGLSTHQVVTSVYDRKNMDWLSQQIPRILARVAYQKAPAPFLWNHQRTYPLLVDARPGTALHDVTDGVCGYITGVSHQIQGGSPGSFKASTSLQVERVVEGATFASYPAKVRAYLGGMKWHSFKHSPEAENALIQIKGVAPTGVNGKFNRAQPVSGTMVLLSGPGALRANGTREHDGYDYAMTAGTALHSPCDGKLVDWGTQTDAQGHSNTTGAGYWLKIKGDDKSEHFFAHLSTPCALAKNSNVTVGMVVGYSGGIKGAPGSGDSSGPHLHWRVFLQGKKIMCNPMDWVSHGGPAS